MTIPATEPAVLLPWDTAFFGRRVGRVIGDRLDPGRAHAVDAWARRNAVEVVYFLACSDDPLTPVAAEAAGFRFVDIRLTFALDRPIASTPARPDVRAARADDLHTLKALAGISHADTRFFFDPTFGRERAQALYAAWIQRAFEDAEGVVWVSVDGQDRPLGYLTCHSDKVEGVGEIGLVAVDPTAQGQGLGRALIDAGLTWFADRGVRRVTVVTQGRNRAAQRLYQRSGFLTDSLALWFHKWFMTGDGTDA